MTRVNAHGDLVFPGNHGYGSSDEASPPSDRLRDERRTVDMTSGFVKVSTRDEWLKNRRGGIGASDAAAILGVNPWRSAFAVWAEKTGFADADDLSDNEAVEFGIQLEQPIAESYAARTGRNVAMWPAYQLAHHPTIDWLRCTPDATQHDDVRGKGLLQVKTTSAFKAADWADGPPLMYEVQVQNEMAVTGFDWCTLVVLIGGQRLRYFDCDRNERFIAAMLPKLEAFWRLVETRTEPPVDGSLATAKVLAKLHPDDTGDTVMLPQEAGEWTAQVEQAKSAIKEAEEVKTAFENRLKAALGDSTFGLLSDGSRWSWKRQDRKGYVVEPTSFRVLRKLK